MRSLARRAYLDNLKVVLVAAVIVAHVLITYGDLGSWAYLEPSGNPAFLVPATLFVAVGSLFAMGLFFLVAGLLTPGALARKGSAAFLKDRVLRLGLPFAVFLLLVYPAVEWAGERSGESPAAYLRGALVGLDPGPLWFVLVLLIYSVGFVGVRRVWPYRDRQLPPVSVGRFLVVLAVTVAVTTFLVRLWFPVDSFQVFALHLWQWPQCLGLFILGTTAAERGWLDPVPPTVSRRAAVSAASGAVVTVIAFAVSHDAVEPFAGGASWQAFLTAGCEAVMAVGLSVWLLGLFQRRFDRASRRAARAAGRAAFGAYVLQAPVVVSLALCLSAVALTPEIKALVVAPAAVITSFALAWVLAQIPGVRRIV